MATKEPAAVDAADEKLVEAVVRQGTVMVGNPPNEEAVGPGGTVQLPADEVAALRRRGVLVDPAQAPTFAVGPKVDIDLVDASAGSKVG